MKKQPSIIFFVLFTLSVLIFTLAGTVTGRPVSSGSAPSAEAIDKLFELSGLTRQVNEFPDLIKADIESAIQNGASIPEDHLAIMLKTVDWNPRAVPSCRYRIIACRPGANRVFRSAVDTAGADIITYLLCSSPINLAGILPELCRI